MVDLSPPPSNKTCNIYRGENIYFSALYMPRLDDTEFWAVDNKCIILRLRKKSCINNTK